MVAKLRDEKRARTEARKAEQAKKKKTEKEKPPTKETSPVDETPSEPKQNNTPRPTLTDGAAEIERQNVTLHGSITSSLRFIRAFDDNVDLSKSMETTILQGTRSSDAPIQAEGDEHVTLIHGPPGTGKTHALLERVAMFRETHPECRCLVTAISNNAVCSLYRRAWDQGLRGTLVMQPDRIRPETVRYGASERSLWSIQSDKLIFATIAERSAFALRRRGFDAIFVDEAAQCPEAVIWTLFRKDMRYLIMSGDPDQLPGLLQSDVAKELQYDRSLMARLMQNGYPSTFLHRNYRLNPVLLRFPNEQFYNGRMESAYVPPTDMPHTITSHPFQIINVDGEQESVGTSSMNVAEVDIVVNESRRLLAILPPQYQHEVVALTPYAAQVEQLRKRLPATVSAYTVDSFQGRESAVVLLSTVRTDGGGFWADPRRVNVAVTRAKHQLIVVGNVSSWKGSLYDMSVACN